MDDKECDEYELFLSRGIIPSSMMGNDKAKRAFRKRAHRFDLSSTNTLTKNGMQVLRVSNSVAAVMEVHTEDEGNHKKEAVLFTALKRANLYIKNDEATWASQTCLICRHIVRIRIRMDNSSRFTPISQKTQKALCREYGVDWNELINFIPSDVLGSEVQIHPINNLDNACFYRCISVAISGSEDNWKLIKEISLKGLKKNANAVARMLMCNIAFLNIKSYESSKLGTNCPVWLGLAAELGLDIIVHSKILDYERDVSKDWFLYPADLKGEHFTKEAIYLEATKYHVDLIISTSNC